MLLLTAYLFCVCVLCIMNLRNCFETTPHRNELAKVWPWLDNQLELDVCEG